MPWTIVRNWAELALIVAVFRMFETCHGVLDVLKVIRDADDLTRLGIVTAIVIASNGFAGMVTAAVHSLGLPRGLDLLKTASATLKRTGKRRGAGAHGDRLGEQSSDD